MRIIKVHTEDFCEAETIPYSMSSELPDNGMILHSFNHGEVRQLIDSIPYKEVGLQTLLLETIDVIEENSKSKKIITLSGKEKAPLSEEDSSALKIQNWFQAVQAYSRSVQGTRFLHLERTAEGTPFRKNSRGNSISQKRK